jgi:hypothetical protein
MEREKFLEIGQNTRFSSERQPANRGRKPGIKNRSTLAREALSLPASLISKNSDLITLQDPDTGIEYHIPTEYAISLRLARKALEDGDVAAYNALMDSAYGKPKQSLEVQENNATPIDYSNFNETELAIIKQAQELLANQRNRHIDEAEIEQ